MFVVSGRLQSRRKELGFSQAEVARDLDISVQKLGKYERGQDRMRPATSFWRPNISAFQLDISSARPRR
jgi:transcriptional regulator with XRE-family HTH domain